MSKELTVSAIEVSNTEDIGSAALRGAVQAGARDIYLALFGGHRAGGG